MGVWLVTGSDVVLQDKAVARLVDDLVGDGDRALTLTRIREEDLRDADSEWSLAPLIDAAQTPPFLTERRVVVGHHLARFARDCGELVRLLANLLAAVDLVLVWQRGQKSGKRTRLPPVPKELRKAVESSGGKIIKTDAPFNDSRQNNKWLKEQIAETGLRFEPAAVAALAGIVGQDRGLVVGYLRTLAGALSEEARVTVDDVERYSGDPGSLAPWELDNAIDRGDIKTAVRVLQRQLLTQNPFMLLAWLHRRYQRMLRLDGAGVRNQAEAAKILNMKPFPARKLLSQVDLLGSKNIAESVRLLAEADLALRGMVDWPHDLILEVLVARLASMVSRSSRR